MRPLPLALPLTLVAAACLPPAAQFTDSSYRAKYPYSVAYAGKSQDEIVSSDWRLDNYYLVAEGPDKGLHLKDTDKYKVNRSYDFDGDGKVDYTHDEPFYDLLLEHRRMDAALWVRTVPMGRGDADKELRVIAQRYVDAASGAGSVVVRFGAEGPIGSIEKRFASRILETENCTVSGKESVLVDFEVANVDQLQLSENARWLRGRIVITRAGFTSLIENFDSDFPVLMLTGLSASPNDFAQLEPDFDRLLDHISIAANDKGGATTCHGSVAKPEARANAAANTSGGEAAPATASTASEPVPSPVENTSATP